MRRASIVFPEPGATDHQHVVPSRRSDLRAPAWRAPVPSRLRNPPRIAPRRLRTAPPPRARRARSQPRRSAAPSPPSGSRRPARPIPSTTAASAGVVRAAASSLRNPSPRALHGHRQHARARVSASRRATARPRTSSRRAPRHPRCPVAARIPTAIGRSNEAPSLRRSAGARFTTTLRPDIRSPEFSNAARMRCSLSLTALSGSPDQVHAEPAARDVDLDRHRHGVDPHDRARISLGRTCIGNLSVRFNIVPARLPDVAGAPLSAASRAPLRTAPRRPASAGRPNRTPRRQVPEPSAADASVAPFEPLA